MDTSNKALIDDLGATFSYHDGKLVRTRGIPGHSSATAVGTIKPDGYRSVCRRGKFYQVHRVIWALHYGAFPSGPIDHINGVRSDNRIENLRLCTASENQQNRVVSKTSRTGFKGVLRIQQGKKFRALISINGKHVHLGTFDDAVSAALCYDAAHKLAGKKFARPNIVGNSIRVAA